MSVKHGLCHHLILTLFVLKILSAYLFCYIYSDALKNTFTMKANTMNPDQTSLIWVHIVCNIAYQSAQTEDRADNNFHKEALNWKKVNLSVLQNNGH